MPTQANPILLPPRSLLASLVSFEALLVLYMFAGFYKEDPRFTWLPADATALFFALSVLVGSFIILVSPIHKKGLPVIFAMICLVTWFLVSLLWSPSRVYGPNKVFFMATLGLWAVIAAALIIVPDPERVRRLFSLLLLLGLWMGIEALLVHLESGRTQIQVGSANYLMLGRGCGLGAVIALAGWLFGGGRMAGRLCLVLFFVLMLVLAVGGGRGPLLATGLALLLPLALGIRLTRRKIMYSPTLVSVSVLLLVAVAGVGLYSVVTGDTPGTFKRFERMIDGLEAGEFRASEGKRVEHYATAVRLWAQAPLLGHGAGSWPLLTNRPDDRYFPHNMFLEVLVETGLVGLVLLVALFATVLRPVTLERLRGDPQALCAMMACASVFFDTMLSGDLPDNRVLFLLIGVLALFAVRPVAAAAPARAAAVDLSMAHRGGADPAAERSR